MAPARNIYKSVSEPLHPAPYPHKVQEPQELPNPLPQDPHLLHSL